jgi:hypothetical protein
MVDPLRPGNVGPMSGVNRVAPASDRKPKKRNPEEQRRARDDEEDQELQRKGRRIDDHA